MTVLLLDHTLFDDIVNLSSENGVDAGWVKDLQGRQNDAVLIHRKFVFESNSIKLSVSFPEQHSSLALQAKLMWGGK